MKLDQKIGQRLMIGIRGPSLDPETRAHLRRISPGGVILFSRNIRSREQVRELIEQIKEIVQQFQEEGIATVDKPPKIQGRNIIAFLTPNK